MKKRDSIVKQVFITILLIIIYDDFALSAQVPSNITGYVNIEVPMGGNYDPERDPIPIEQNISLSDDAFASLHGDWTQARVNPEGITWSATYVASSEVYGGLKPLAVAQAGLAVSTTDDSIRVSSGASAAAKLTYEVVIVERRSFPPGAYIPPIYVLVNAMAEVSLSGAPYVSDRAIASAVVALSNSSTSGTRNWSKKMQISAIADPEISFDQARFDQDMAALGYDSFKLDDYLELEYSEGIIKKNIPPVTYVLPLLLDND
nr:hypothetical protein [uncultured Desulfobulbus sp.]